MDATRVEKIIRNLDTYTLPFTDQCPSALVVCASNKNFDQLKKGDRGVLEIDAANQFLILESLGGPTAKKNVRHALETLDVRAVIVKTMQPGASAYENLEDELTDSEYLSKILSEVESKKGDFSVVIHARSEVDADHLLQPPVASIPFDQAFFESIKREESTIHKKLLDALDTEHATSKMQLQLKPTSSDVLLELLLYVMQKINVEKIDLAPASSK